MSSHHPANTTSNHSAPLQSVRWNGDHLLLLDQRQLPEHIEFVRIDNSQQAWEAIHQLKVRGAPAIGMAAAYGLYLSVRNKAVDLTHQPDWQKTLLEEVDHQADYLATSRPTAVNLFWALNRMKQRAESLILSTKGSFNAEHVAQALLQEAVSIQQEDEETCRKIGVHALTLFADGMGVLTHCNAGALATAKYGTALAPIYLAHEQGWRLKVFADETRPVLQGARLTAFELQQAGIDVTLICDNMAGTVMARGWIDAVIVGTDRVAANGDVANKIGTYGLAVLAKAHQIPFYVACPLSTIDLNTPTGREIPIEERPAEEVTQGFGKRTAPVGIKVFNPAFDITPQDYVTAIITEKGVIGPPYDRSLQELFSTRLP